MASAAFINTASPMRVAMVSFLTGREGVAGGVVGRAGKAVGDITGL